MLFSGQPGARAELEFRGSAIDLEILEGPGSGMARIWIDGSDARADLVPKSAGGVARLDLYATESGFAAVPLASGLPSGLHRMTLEVVGARAPDSAGELVMIRAAIAGEPAPRWPIWLGTAAAAAGAALALGSLLNWWSGRWRWRPVIERVQIADAPALLLAAVLLTLVATIPAAGPGDPWFWIRLASLAALGLLGTAAPAALATVTVAGWLLAPVAVPLGPLHLNPGELGLAALTGAWGVRATLLGRVEFGIASRHLPLLLLFLGAALAATAAAEYPKVAVRGLRLLVLEPLWLGCLVATYLVGRRRLLLAGAVAGAAGIAAVLAMLSGGIEFFADGQLARLRGPWGSPNGLALVLERGLPLALALALAAAGVDRRIGLAALLLAIAAALLATLSRGGWLAGAVGAAALAQIAWGAARPFLGRWLAPLVGLAVGIGLVISALAGFGADTLDVRLRLWGSAALMAGDNLWLGVGPDNFLYRLPDYLDPQMWREPNLSHPHNLLLDAWLSLGVAGVAALALLLTRSVSVIARGLTGRSGALFWADAGILAAMAAGVVHGLLDNFYFRPELAAFFWLFFAYSLAVERDPLGDRREGLPGDPAVGGRLRPETAF
ncbi:MAG: O-antigen ligase family protein [Chloroflexi bacterium]|nr:O-antigen ligase family protein [Chloroflexota bacterium]MYC47787.1 O-antigen ligase family protein [Chloroflexota bacterium]